MRSLKKEEFDLIVYLLNDKPNTEHIIEKLPNLMVEEMNDGGMGSLQFVSDKKRKYGAEIARVSLSDADGISVLFCVDLDEEGEIYELDVFKGDSSPLKQFPVPPYLALE